MDFDLSMSDASFYKFTVAMSIIGLFVFVALFFVKAGYGKFASRSWGVTIPNKVGWVLMEAPVFFVLLLMWLVAPTKRRYSAVHLIFLLLFELHYFQRSFIFPLLVKGKGQMPISIMVMGIVFNVCNGIMQGEWIFFVSPSDYYNGWLANLKFIIGTIIFLSGMAINIHSDHVIRSLRKPGDEGKHFLPNGGFYKYVTSANYFGEIVEWLGFSILTWSVSGAVFLWWTIANLVPRSFAIYSRYLDEFGSIVLSKRRIIPFIL